MCFLDFQTSVWWWSGSILSVPPVGNRLRYNNAGIEIANLFWIKLEPGVTENTCMCWSVSWHSCVFILRCTWNDCWHTQRLTSTPATGNVWCWEPLSWPLRCGTTRLCGMSTSVRSWRTFKSMTCGYFSQYKPRSLQSQVSFCAEPGIKTIIPWTPFLLGLSIPLWIPPPPPPSCPKSPQRISHSTPPPSHPEICTERTCTFVPSHVCSVCVDHHLY